MVMGVSSSSRGGGFGGIGSGDGDNGESPYVNVRLGSNGREYAIETESQSGDDSCCKGCNQWWTRLCNGIRDWFAKGAAPFTQAHMRTYSRDQGAEAPKEDDEEIFGYVGQFPKPSGGGGEEPGNDDDVTYSDLIIRKPPGGPHRHEDGGDDGTIYSDVRTGGPRQSGGGSGEPSTRF